MATQPARQEIDEPRRRLLGTSMRLGAVGLGIGAFGVAMVAPRVATSAPKEPAPSLGYHETEHILDYYRTAA